MEIEELQREIKKIESQLNSTSSLADLIDTPAFRKYLINRENFEEIEQKSQNRTACKIIIKQAIDGLQQNLSDKNIQTRTVDMIGCAVVYSSFAANLLPEQILEIVYLGLLTQSWAREYAENYEYKNDRMTVLTGLGNINNRPKLPNGYDNLKDILRKWPKTLHDLKLQEWLREQEKVGNEKLADFIDTLRRQTGKIYGPYPEQVDFDKLLEKLKRYEPFYTEPLSDKYTDHYFEILTEITESWLQLPYERGCHQCIRIIPLILKTPRPRLLGSLEVMAPAIQIFHAEVIADIMELVRQIVDKYP